MVFLESFPYLHAWKANPLTFHKTQHQIIGGKRSPNCKDQFCLTSSYFLCHFLVDGLLFSCKPSQKNGKENLSKKAPVAQECFVLGSKPLGPLLMKCTAFPRDVSNPFLGEEEPRTKLRRLKKVTKCCYSTLLFCQKDRRDEESLRNI